jgi:hypothetical protein
MKLLFSPALRVGVSANGAVSIALSYARAAL